ncbi:NACHT, LRR and PYD domains-containing protein 11 isoform X2 [Symphalangus syndactylus]|uniref:NACHT, LRR and PYD domains-containing protein 11 isoform X2 n=2 Tax=Symphalangus syndactylus TaxID=9590 RepID=UPI0024433F03|nr:NACHT, LRR and PYD domains-containing protein 11 isoform X2 [Symphalangus syndactylus]
MAESDSTDFDLLWYLENLSEKEFQSFKKYLARKILDFKLPQVPVIQMTKEELANVLPISYEGQYIWNMLYSIFLMMRKEDLCRKIIRRRNRNQETCKALMRRKFMLQWESHTFGEFHYKFFCDVTSDVFYILQLAYDSTSCYSANDLNVFLVGDRASGKTMVINLAVSRWIKGEMWQNMISYVVHLTSHEINQMPNRSLAELIAKDWPDGQAPIADILSDPKKLLFIIEDLDNIRFELNVNESALCSNSTQKVPIPILLVSLLKRKMAPGCWFLISSRPTSKDNVKLFLKETDCYTTLQLSNEKREIYFNSFFKDRQRASAAFKLVHEDEILVGLCRVAILCWITCTVLNRQMDKGRDFQLCCQTPTDLHAHFLADALTSEAGLTANQYHLGLLKRLCLLAAGGLFLSTLNFSGEDLRCVGLTEADVSVLQAANILLPSSTHKSRYKFIHLNVQEFCAAIAFLMAIPNCLIPSGGREYKEKREQCSDFNQVFTFIFGLLNENRRKILETSFGYQLPLVDSFKWYSVGYMKQSGRGLEKLTHHMPLFYCLYENREEEFVKKIVDALKEVTLYLQSDKDMMVSLYCLEYCCHLRTLKLSVQRIFQNKEPLVRPTARLSYVSTASGFEDLLKALAHNRSLTYLSLNCTSISVNMFSLLHEILDEPTCQISHLSLMKCDLRASECEEIASLLVNGGSLRKLTLSNNPLRSDGVKILCDALLHPNCTLISLVLVFCCLTENCCSSLGRVLLLSPTLKQLDLCVNHLKNYGVLHVTFPLIFPTCQLEELHLSGCFFSSDICQYIAIVIATNEKLRSLEIGSNSIEDAGMQLLCGGLRHPNCMLVNIGLEECMLTSACCRSLASVLTTNKTLERLNLLQNHLGNEGVVKLLESLIRPDCVLKVVGLPLTGLSTQTQQLLMTVKERKPNLIFLSETWSLKEGREIGVTPASQPGSIIPNSNLDYMFFKFPRMSAAMRTSNTASRQPL